MAQHLAVSILVAGVVAAGGLAAWGSDGGALVPRADDGPAALQPEDTPMASSGRILVSTPGHRMTEFMVARSPADPLHLVAIAMDLDGPAASVGCAAFVTRDGGASWEGGAILPMRQGWTTNWDPWASIDAQGRAHAVCMGRGPAGGKVLYARSEDGGLAWGPASVVPFTSDANPVDKPAVLVDGAGTIHVCVFEVNVGLVLSRSFDGAQTWAPPVAILPGTASGCNGIEEAQGALLVNFRQSATSGGIPAGAVGVVRSLDGGSTWGAPGVVMVAKNCRGAGGPCPAGYDTRPFPTFAAFATSPTNGTVFHAVASLEERGPPVPGPRSPFDRYVLHVHRSTDGGQTFAPLAVPLPAAPGCGDCHAVHPTPVVDAQGRVGLQYLLEDEAGPAQPREVWFTRSLDDGLTWSAPELVAATALPESYADPRAYAPDALALAQGLAGSGAPAALAQDQAFTVYNAYIMRHGGHYLGLGSSGGAFLPVWTDFHANGAPQLWTRILAA